MQKFFLNVCGPILGVKKGMMRVFDKNGSSVVITLVQVDDNAILETKTVGSSDRVVLGYSVGKRADKVNKPQRTELERKGLPLYRKRSECVISDGVEGSLELGSILDTSSIAEGSVVDVEGFSLGKQFCGVIKRHGFKGDRSNNASCVKRAHGSTGQRQDPGKVFKNKKMAGRDGNKKVTTKNLRVFFVDSDRRVVAITGCIPGAKGSFIKIYPSKRSHPYGWKLAFHQKQSV